VVDEGLDRFAGEAALLDALRRDLAAFVASVGQLEGVVGMLIALARWWRRR
jgi:hypothetical protein